MPSITVLSSLTGAYLEPPYTVTRRGIRLSINGVKAWDWPIDYPNVPKEPGLPPGVTKDWSLGDLYLFRPGDDSWDARQRRWIESHYELAEAERRIIEYYKQLPCVKSVRVPASGHLEIEDYRNSEYWSVYLGLSPVQPLSKETVLARMEYDRKETEERLESGDCIFYFSGSDDVFLQPYKVATNLGLAVDILSSDRPAGEKLNLLRRMGFMSRKDEVRFPELISGFHASKVLRERIARTVAEQKVIPRRLEDLPAEKAVALASAGKAAQ